MDAHDVVGLIADDVEARLDDVVRAMAEAILSGAPHLPADDAIRADMVASCRGNARRYLAIARSAAAPPPSDVPPEALDFARTVVRRGIENDAIYIGYRLGQEELWRQWMAAADRCAPADQLADVLKISAGLMFNYGNDALDRVLAEVEREREQVRGEALARRGETIRLLLDGAPLDPFVAGQRLHYDLARHHTALVLWTDAGDEAHGELETTAATLAHARGARRPLTLAAGVGTVWAWIGGDTGLPAQADPANGVAIPPHVRVAVGLTLPGAAGFRRSHEGAVAVRRLMQRAADGPRVGTYDEYEITTLAASDEPRARDFVTRTLGPLADDGPAPARLRETLRVFLDEADNAPRTGARMHLHRNTILQRVARAEDLLGFPLGAHRLAVALALELHRMGITGAGPRTGTAREPA